MCFPCFLKPLGLTSLLSTTNRARVLFTSPPWHASCPSPRARMQFFRVAPRRIVGASLFSCLICSPLNQNKTIKAYPGNDFTRVSPTALPFTVCTKRIEYNNPYGKEKKWKKKSQDLVLFNCFIQRFLH